MNQPIVNSYDNLKSKLIERTSITERQRLNTLLSQTELGDQKPSQVIRSLQRLLGPSADSMDPALFKQLFLLKLPTHLQPILVSAAPSLTLEEVAEMADRMSDSAIPMISAISEPKADPDISNHIIALT